LNILNKLSIVAIVLAIYVTITSSSGGITGVSQGGCSCHGPSSPTTTVSISPTVGTSYTPGQIILYTITVANDDMITETSGAGFNLSANIGTLSVINSDTRKVGAELTHNGTKLSNTGEAVWTVRWTAPTAGSTALQLYVAGNAVNGTGGTDGDFWALGNINPIPLPVEFVHFNANAKNNKIINLNWEIGLQLNASHFEITRSSDGKYFETIGSAKITNKSLYSFQDSKPLSGTNYYQIKQIDLDGQAHYSKVISQLRNDDSIRIYPDIVNDGWLNIDDVPDQCLNYKLVGSNGAVIRRGKLLNNQNNLDVSSAPNGIYIVVIESEIGMVISTRKIVIAR
jgi:hypothetical protein